MISAKGLEPTNFINPDLTWKTVSKGYRRSSRRSRKPVDRSPKSDAETDKGTESPSETTVSESEKLGVAVLGHRFSEKVEQVPIKKRRFTVRSPSPPPCFSSPNEHDDQFLDGPYSSDQGSCLKLFTKKRLIAMDASRKIKNVKHDFNEDFSGIEILAAAAACNNSVDDDLPPKECISSKEGTCFSSRNTVVEAASEDSDFPEHADKTHHGGANDNCNDVDTRKVERSVSSRDVRLHWDLNVEMDAWEQPCDTIIVDSQTNVVDVQGEKPQVLEACELQKELGDDKNNIGTPVQPIIDNEEHKFESISDINKSDDKCVPLEKVLESSTSTGIVVENSPCKESDKFEGSVLSEEIEKTLSVDGSAKEYNEDLSVVAQLSKVEKLEGADTLSENGMASATVCSIDGGLKSQDIISSDGSCPPLPVNKTEDVGISHTELCNEDISTSGVYLGEGQSIVTVNVEGLVTDTLVPCIDKAVHKFEGNSMPIVESVVGSNSHEVSQRCGGSSASSLDRVTTEDTCNDSHILDICDKDISVGKGNTTDCDKDHIVGKENNTDVDAGYDSQYEDGELRESDVPCWEDNDCEDGEAECVDYGTDTCDDTGDYSMSSKFGMQVECSEEEFCVTEVRSLDRNMKAERLMGSGSNYLCEIFEHGAAGDALRQSVGSKVLTSGSDELPRGSEMSSDITAEIPEGYMARKHGADCLAGFDEKDTSAKVVGSGFSRKELPGTVESSSNTLHRSDNILVQGSRSSNFDLCTQPDDTCADHSMGKERSDLLQMQCKSPAGCWDSRRRESPTYNGSFGADRPRPKSVIEGRGYSEAGFAGIDNHVHRQSINSSNGSYRHQPRRSPCSRDDAHNIQRGVGPFRDGSPDRRRFRRYPPGVGRGFREDYHRTMPQNGSDEYPYHVNRMVRREQNTSPPREHDAAKPRSSRSPDYRFDTRMERMRLPFQKQGFGAKCEMGFISPPRRRFSPQHNSRWFNDPNGTSDEYPYHVNRMVRRDQNASPPPRGPVYYRRPLPFKRSQSRSRSRSPGPWMSREHDTKHRSSRSPDYRFDSRMERMRLPFQKQGFGAKCEMGFMSPPRRRFSPQHNSRWFDDPNGGSDHFRGRRLPGRTFQQQQQGQRFDSVGTSRRMNSDDYFEPAMRPARFNEMGRGGGRARRYEGSADERRNNDDRFEVFSRTRRYDSDGVVRRFRYDEEDSFATRNTHNNNLNSDSDNNNGAERRPRNNVYLGSDELKRKVN
ncbi:uncharacterized protein LOC133834684 [Humulus lupulus]|uniref:uncharacterized protein LOC133834684 n=1 Tax=Humulus lupulus TaxID=3486 RepID=UPI002B4070D7|nr:uncharacterized protein LOC133834684 [Humulus lupulus]XP_062120347.1 uncharacterized protein LOC133834684 [Humulus lupulus]